MLLKGSDVEGVLLYGIDPEKEAAVSVIGDYVAADKLQTLADQDGKVSNSILLGKALADRLGLEVGDRVNVMIPQQNAAGRVSPKFVGLQLVALLNTGTELDQSLALTSLQRVLLLMPEQERQQGLRISVTDTFNAPRIAWELSQNIPYGYIARDWTRSHGNLYSAIQLSKQLVGLMLLTIIAVASFNVVSALVMIVTDKRGDIAILRTLGASPAGVMMVFMVQGTLIALIGTTVGGLVGLALAYGITDVVAVVESLFNIHFLNSDVYPIDYLPSDPRLNDVLLVCGTALLMSLLATVYPAWRAARVQPADALRYQ
jgi:lipoprotein-releasing system permease protein